MRSGNPYLAPRRAGIIWVFDFPLEYALAKSELPCQAVSCGNKAEREVMLTFGLGKAVDETSLAVRRILVCGTCCARMKEESSSTWQRRRWLVKLRRWLGLDS